MFTVSVVINITKMLQEEESIDILSVIVLINNTEECHEIYNHVSKKTWIKKLD